MSEIRKYQFVDAHPDRLRMFGSSVAIGIGVFFFERASHGVDDARVGRFGRSGESCHGHRSRVGSGIVQDDGRFDDAGRKGGFERYESFGIPFWDGGGRCHGVEEGIADEDAGEVVARSVDGHPNILCLALQVFVGLYFFFFVGGYLNEGGVELSNGGDGGGACGAESIERDEGIVAVVRIFAESSSCGKGHGRSRTRKDERRD